MIRQRIFAPLLSLSLLPVAFGAVGCSNGSSPTEPAFTEDVAATSVSSSVSAEGEKRRGADDPAGDDRGGNRRGRGNDDPAGDDRGGRGRGGNGNRPGDQPRAPRNGHEFESSVSSVSGNSLSLANGLRVTVNAQTQWSARGDLLSLRQVAASVQSGDPTRVEGRGVRQADGSLLAQTIKAEVDN